MIEAPTIPAALASIDEQGLADAIAWCDQHLEDDQTLYVWTETKGAIRNQRLLHELVTEYSNVAHITGSKWVHAGRGPLLMAWPNLDAIGAVDKTQTTAICVIDWGFEGIADWAHEMRAELLGSHEPLPPRTKMDPVVLAGLRYMTLAANLNNNVGAGYEKSIVAGSLMALNDAGYPLDAMAIEAWAVAHGWTHENPKVLADFVRKINDGSSLRTIYPVNADLVESFRRDAAN